MVTKKISRRDKEFQERLGRKVRKIILTDLGYRSLDSFALEHYDVIAKPTLYQICDGKRDMKVSTLRGLSRALGLSIAELLNEL